MRSIFYGGNPPKAVTIGPNTRRITQPGSTPVAKEKTRQGKCRWDQRPELEASSKNPLMQEENWVLGERHKTPGTSPVTHGDNKKDEHEVILRRQNREVTGAGMPSATFGLAGDKRTLASASACS
ncbi:unnamed protein product [Ectocarpus sp. 12 AP-2014]